MKKIYWCLIGSLITAAYVMGQGQALSLDDCIALARQTNPAIQAAQNGLMAATYTKRAAISTALPVLKADYNHTWLEKVGTMEIPGNPTFPILGHVAALGSPPTTVVSMFPATPGQSYVLGSKEIDSLTLSATQPLYTGGAVYHALMLARLNEQDAGFRIEEVDEEIVYQVRSTYYGVLKAKEFVEVSNQAVEMAESLRQRAQDFFDVGLIAKNQLLQAEVNLAQAKQQQTTAKSGLAIGKAALNILIGRLNQEEIEVKGRLEAVPFSAPMDQCVQTALKQRPEVKSASLRADMAEHMIKITRAGLLPGVAAVGAYSHQEGQFGYPPEQLSFTLGATWTFWDWGKTYYNVKNADEVEAQARQAVRLTEDQIILQVKQAYLKMREAEQNITTARSGIASAEENLRVVKSKFDQNMATSFDVLTAQTMLTGARTSEISALADYMSARAALDRAMGVTAPTQTATGSNQGATIVNPTTNTPSNQAAANPDPHAAALPSSRPAQPAGGN